MKWLRGIVLALTALGLLGGCARQPSEKKPLVVGMELAYPPFEMTDPDGQPAGISVEIARALAAYLGRPLRIENIPFDGLIPALKTGRIDLILSSMTATEERAQSIDFSDPYLHVGLALLIHAGSDVKSAADLNAPGRRVAVKLGTTGELYAKQHLPLAEVHVLREESACVLEVIQGKADAFIYDQMSVYNHWRRNPDTTRPNLEPIRREAWAIGIRKGNRELRDQVNAFLADFRAKGGFDDLGNRYLTEMKSYFIGEGIPFVF